MPLTVRQLRTGKWKRVRNLSDEGFKVFAMEGVDGLTTIHERKADGKGWIIRYRAQGRWFDSISEAVRHWNKEEGRRAGGGPGAAGSPQSLAARKAALS